MSQFLAYHVPKAGKIVSGLPVRAQATCNWQQKDGGCRPSAASIAISYALAHDFSAFFAAGAAAVPQ